MSDFQNADGEEVTPERQARVAAKIGKLIAMAENEALAPEARASYAEQAEKLMREYRIDEERVISDGGDAVTIPIRYRIVLLEGLGRNYYTQEFQGAYQMIWTEVKKHAGLRGHMEYQYDADGTGSLVVLGYGYGIDIRLAQFLWTSAHLTFATRVEARPDRSLSDQLNCYYMRGSGQERNDIATALWGSEKTDGKAHGKVQKLYLAECAARGEEPLVGGRGFIASRYREAYADGFVDQFGWRLRDARSAVDAQSGTLVLKGRAERVAEAYWTEWPDRRPASGQELESQKAERQERLRKLQEEAERQYRDCTEKGKCRAARERAEKRAEERGWPLDEEERLRAQCRDHRPYEPTQADRKRWDRESRSPEKAAGRRAGSAAASSVEFRRTGGDRTQKAPAAPSRPQLGG